MQNIQDIWARIQETKKQQKHIGQMYKDALENMHEYQELSDKIKGLGLRKKQLEAEAKRDLGSEYEKLNALKKDAQLDKELLADIALSRIMKGEQVTVTDADRNEYEPVFSVKFKKTNEVRQKPE